MVHHRFFPVLIGCRLLDCNDLAGNPCKFFRVLELLPVFLHQVRGKVCKIFLAKTNDQKISNRVYQMTCSIWEDTKYDRETKQSVPIAWYVTWEVRIHSPKQGYGAKIAGQNQKRYTDKNAAIKYLDGRKKAYSHLFTEISPPIPKEYEHHFMVHGTLLPGYTVEGLEQAKTEHAAAEVSEGGIFTPKNREKPSVLGKLSVAKTQEKTPAAPGMAMKKKEDIQL